MVWIALVGAAYAVDVDGDGFQAGIDCNDINPFIHPLAPEIRGDGVDQDCNGQEVCYLDLDLDGARSSGQTVSADLDCSDGIEAYASEPLDCADTDSTRSPLLSENVANGVDNDCNGQELCYHDNDGDGEGSSGIVISVDIDCDDLIEAWTSDDCDDSNPLSYPGAAEMVGDEIDQDCNGGELCYLDLDQDGSRSLSLVASVDQSCLALGEAPLSWPIDCDDDDEMRYVGAAEIVGDEIDEDCDAKELCYVDEDDDGARGIGTRVSFDAACSAPLEAVAAALVDCDDLSPETYPGAVEMCDGFDNDCDGVIDPIDLTEALPGVAGALNSWEVIGGPASSTARLLTSLKLGERALATCPDLLLDLGASRTLATALTDINGDVTLSGTAPAGAAGRDIYAQVFFPATCELSCVSVTSF